MHAHKSCRPGDGGVEIAHTWIPPVRYRAPAAHLLAVVGQIHPLPRRIPNRMAERYRKRSAIGLASVDRAPEFWSKMRSKMRSKKIKPDGDRWEITSKTTSKKGKGGRGLAGQLRAPAVAEAGRAGIPSYRSSNREGVPRGTPFCEMVWTLGGSLVNSALKRYDALRSFCANR